jgi:hypothetical protein
MNNLSPLTPIQLGEAHKAADYLCELGGALDVETGIKLDTLRADLMAEIEDRAQVDLDEHRGADVG